MCLQNVIVFSLLLLLSIISENMLHKLCNIRGDDW
jgi:hypothetical protein